MRYFTLLFFIPVLLFLTTSCGSIDITYIGESFKPTQEAQIYFKKGNIHRSYEVMGKVIARAPDTFTGQEIQKKLIKTAREKGADAVLVTLYTQIPRGSSCFNNDPYNGFGGGYGGYDGGYGCDPYYENAYWGGGESVQYYYEILIKAEFLRYTTDASTQSTENNIQNSRIK